MRFLYSLATVLLLLCFALQTSAQSISNRGKDFWVGYGYHQYMGLGNNPPNDQNMTLYLSVEDLPPGKAFATVTVEVDSSDPNRSLWWRRTYRIPANTVISTDNTPAFSFSPASAFGNGPMPKGPVDAGPSGTAPTWDFRLYNANGCPNPINPLGHGIFTGKGFHITSDEEIVAYAHNYGGVSSGATMLLPVSSWGYSYTTLNSAQNSVTDASGFFFVIAQEDSTMVKITPSQIPIQISCVSATPQVPYTIMLNKGWIYQYRGQANNNTQNGVDLTGSKIESIPNQVGKCKRIAVFAGSGRTGGESSTGCGIGGRDNDMQQCFPEHTWGNTYLSAPFATDGNPVNACAQAGTVYKVVAKDTGTIVTITSTTGNLTQLIPPYGFVRFSSNAPCRFVGNKPISVAQYMTGSNCGTGDGDPEMIYLSPIEQAISNVNFYRQNREAINSNFVSVIIPDSGLANLTIDGQARVAGLWGANSCVRPHPQYPGHSIVIKGWASARAQVRINCTNARFNTITYGVGGAESYGYSGGTFLNNLSGLADHVNTRDTLSTRNSWNYNYPYIYNNSPFEPKVNMAYPPRKIDWLFGEMAKDKKFIDTSKVKLFKVCDGQSPTNITDTQRGYFYTPPFKYIGNDTFYVRGCEQAGPCETDMHVVTIGCPFFANTNSVNVTRTSGIPPFAGNAATDLAAVCGNAPYRYTLLNIFGRDTTRSVRGGIVSLNANSGAFTYAAPAIPTPATFNGRDTLLVRICDNGQIPPFTCFVKPYYITIGTQFNADTVVVKNATPQSTALTNNAAIELNVVGGRVPYTYSSVNISGALVATTASGASITLAGSNYTYTPLPGFSGLDSFYIRVCDGNTPTACLIQKHIVTVGQTFSANTSDVNNFTTINSAYVGSSAINLNPTGGIGGYTYSLVNGSGTNTAISNKGCTVTIKPSNGLFIYTPTVGLTGIDSFYIKVCDASATPNCATQLYIVNISSALLGTTSTVNHNVNNASNFSGTANTEFNATGGNGPYSYSIVNYLFVPNANASSRGGSLTLNSTSGAYTYTPPVNYVGKDTFYIRLSDASTTPRTLIQMHIVSVFPAIIGNSLPFYHSIAGDKDLSGNLWVEMPSLSKNSTTRYIPIGLDGQYKDSSTRKGLVSMVPLPVDTLIDPVKGNRFYYRALPYPCEYIFKKTDSNSLRIDTIFIPIVVYSKPINGLPTGCFGAGGVVGDTVNLEFYVFPSIRFDTTFNNRVKLSSCPSDTMVRFILPDSSINNFVVNNKVEKVPAIRWTLTVTGTFKGSPVVYNRTIERRDNIRELEFPLDTGTMVKAEWNVIFSQGALRSYVHNFPYVPSRVNFEVSATSICKGQPITVTSTTFSATGLDSSYYNFNDGSGFIQAPLALNSSITHTYNTFGNFTIEYRVKITGCDNVLPTVTKTIQVNDRRFPVIAYPTSCLDTTGKADFWYDSIASPGTPIKTYRWFFGDPASGPLDSSNANPTSHVYPRENNYTVKLFVEDLSGCKGDTTITIPLNITPNVRFNSPTSEYCANDASIYSLANLASCLNFNKVQGTGVFSGVGIDALGNFNPSLAANTSQTILYTYTSGSGVCSTSVAQTVIVNPKPTVDFSYTTGCLPKTGVAKFNNLSVNGFLFNWNFDDAGNSYYTNNPNIVDSLSPTHRFYNTKTYNVKLFSETDKGCKDSIVKPIVFTVTPEVNYPPLSAVCESQNTIPVNTASITNGVANSSVVGNYFGLGVSSNGQLSPAVSGYGNNTITYIATLTGSDGLACIDSMQQTVLVKAKPIVGYSYPVGCLPSNGVVQFIDTSRMPDAQTIQSCTWNFGNPASGAANSANTCNATHTYSFGTYIVYHTVTSSLGCTADKTDTLTFSISPSLFYNAIPSVCESDTTHNIKYAGSNNLTQVPGNGVYRGIGVVDSINGIINPRLMGAGTFTMYYDFTATSGCKRTDSQTIVVRGGPRGTFSFTPNGCLNASGNVQFNSAGITVNGSTISNYDWNFGTAGTSTQTNPLINFVDGSYPLSLSVTAANGCRYDTGFTQAFSRIPSLGILTNNDTCENIAPFNLRSAPVLNGVVGSFSFKSFKNAVTDSINGTYNPSLAGFGIDTIYCTYTTPAGCATTVSKAIRILGRPLGMFTYTPFKTCLNTAGTVNFNANTITVAGSSIANYTWTFTNKSTAVVQNASVVNPTPTFDEGIYDIRLVVSGLNGCAYDTTITDTFNRTPLLEPINQAAICTNGGSVTLTRPNVLNTVNGSGVFTSFKNALSPMGSLSYDPSISGYGFDTLYYTFTSNGGCVSIEKLPVEVKSRPTGTFTYSPAAGICLDTTGKVVFDASNITAPGYAIKSYNWDFAKGRTDTGVSPTVYFNEGSDTIKLRVYGTNDCWFDTSLVVNFGKTANISPFAIDAICSNGTVVPIPTPNVLNGVIGAGLFTSFKNAVVPVNLYDPNIAGSGKDTLYYSFTSAAGCPATQKFVVEVKPRPSGSFSFTPNASCLDTAGTVNFTANYTMASPDAITGYVWNFGNNTALGTGANINSNYNEGNYTIKLRVNASNNCFTEDSIVTSFTKTPAIALISSINPCENGSTQNVSQPIITNLVTGNGVFSSFKNAINPAGLYTPSTAGFGIDTIYYTYTSKGGCVAIQKQPIEVKARPYGNFVFAPTSGCLDVNGRVVFTSNINVPNSSAQSYSWNFGDNSANGTGAIVAHNYAQDGNYTILLTTIGTNGCSSETSLQATFNRTPLLGNFVYNNPICDNHSPFNFSAPSVLNAVAGNGVFTSAKGAITNAATGEYNPSFAGFGTDTITYTYTSLNGGCPAIRTLVVNILAAPTGNFTFLPDNGCLDVNGSVRFSTTNVRVRGSFPTLFEWDFGNGTGTGANPITFYADGTYDIKLKVTGNNSCVSNFQISSQQFSRTPLLNPIVINNAVCGNTNAFLLNPPTVANNVTGATGVFSSFRNNVTGNAATGYFYNPKLVNYILDTVFYKFTSFAGCSTTVKKVIYINPVPVVKLKYPTNICLNDSSLLRDVSTLIYGNVDSTYWIFKDTTIINPTDRMLNRTFKEVGYLGINLKVKSDSGCIASDSFTVGVRPNPTASFSHNNVVCMPNGSVFFNNNSSVDVFGGTLSYNWNFGDVASNITNQNANTSTIQNPKHTYATVSNYIVSLTAISRDFGCKDTYFDTLRNTSPFFDKPVANFFVSKDTICQDEFVVFTDTASVAPGSNIFSWTWNYGDGTTPNTTIVPTSTYAYRKISNSFSYNASLTIRSKELCESNPFTKTIVVYPRPQIDSLQPIYAMDGTIAQFKPKVNDSINTSFTWTGNAPYFTTGLSNANALSPYLMVNMATALGSNPQGVTNLPILYQLVAEGQNNCTDTAYQVVRVLGKITIPNSFSPNGDGINDTWDISSIGDYPNARIDIFDRYGNKVVSLSGTNMRWDGRINGTPAPVATYYYLINAGSNVPQFSGWVMLFR
jgi:gliding motility-associated-like protein